jgi:hypothetical protein
MASQLADVAAGYAKLASTLGKLWGDHAATVSAKLEAGGYRADDAVRDAAATALVAGRSWFLIASEALDAVAILTDTKDEPAESGMYESPLPGATLALTGPLEDAFGLDALPVAAVTILPAALDPGVTAFMLRADVTGHVGGSYEGTVTASAAGVAPQTIDVQISVQ